ncbi:MAG: helix-turn-helix domain-containing protein [Chitinophagales bacterium]|nr:helix-turn-helix domain-containing protein [Chitinophagales bacterium]
MDDKEFLIKLGNKIVELRTEKGLRQIDLSDLIGIEDSALRRIEKGRVNSSINMLRKIAKALNVSISDLVKVN